MKKYKSVKSLGPIWANLNQSRGKETRIAMILSINDRELNCVLKCHLDKEGDMRLKRDRCVWGLSWTWPTSEGCHSQDTEMTDRNLQGCSISRQRKRKEMSQWELPVWVVNLKVKVFGRPDTQLQAWAVTAGGCVRPTFWVRDSILILPLHFLCKIKRAFRKGTQMVPAVPKLHKNVPLKQLFSST